jgi:hypothetical protein
LQGTLRIENFAGDGGLLVMNSWMMILFLLIGTLGAQTKSPPSKPAAGLGASALPGQGDRVRDPGKARELGKDGFTVRVQGGVAYWDGSTNVVHYTRARPRAWRGRLALRKS